MEILLLNLDTLFHMDHTIVIKSCFKSYVTSYCSIYNENVMDLSYYCSLLIFCQFLRFTRTGEGVKKISIYLKNENSPLSFDTF
jgi:hypothetical protein